MRLTRANYKATDYACRNFHYSKSTPSVLQSYNVYNDADEWCGCIVYSLGANNHIADPYHKWNGQVIELVRMALNGKQGHGNTSKALAMSLKLLHKQYPYIDMVVSYADSDQDHIGIVYQCTNWIYTGLMNEGQRGSFLVKGKKTHPKTCYSRGWKQNIDWIRENIDPYAEVLYTKGKQKYLYPLTKEMRKMVEPLRKDYPKKQ